MAVLACFHEFLVLVDCQGFLVSCQTYHICACRRSPVRRPPRTLELLTCKYYCDMHLWQVSQLRSVCGPCSDLAQPLSGARGGVQEYVEQEDEFDINERPEPEAGQAEEEGAEVDILQEQV